MKSKLFFVVFFVIAQALFGCGSGKKSLIDRNVPDESMISKRPPLSMPPDFKLIPPKEEQAIEGKDQKSKGKTSKEQKASAVNTPVKTTKNDIVKPVELTKGDESFMKKVNSIERSDDLSKSDKSFVKRFDRVKQYIKGRKNYQKNIKPASSKNAIEAKKYNTSEGSRGKKNEKMCKITDNY